MFGGKINGFQQAGKTLKRPLTHIDTILTNNNGFKSFFENKRVKHPNLLLISVFSVSKFYQFNNIIVHQIMHTHTHKIVFI